MGGKMGETDVPTSIQATIGKVTDRFFPRDSKSLRPRQAKCYNLYAAAFRNDFSFSSRTSMSVEHLVRKLNKWKFIISNHLDQSISFSSGKMHMEDRTSNLV